MPGHRMSHPRRPAAGAQWRIQGAYPATPSGLSMGLPSSVPTPAGRVNISSNSKNTKSVVTTRRVNFMSQSGQCVGGRPAPRTPLGRLQRTLDPIAELTERIGEMRRKEVEEKETKREGGAGERRVDRGWRRGGDGKVGGERGEGNGGRHSGPRSARARASGTPLAGLANLLDGR